MIYYYIDSHGTKHGSISHYKVLKLAEQNHIITPIYKCTMSEFSGPDCVLHDIEWKG